MKKLSLVLLLMFPSALAAQNPVVPERLARARYAVVAIMDVKGEIDYGFGVILAPEDRQALVRVEDALRKWKRYVVTRSPEQAELVIVVRTARPLAAYGGIGTGVGSERRRRGSSRDDSVTSGPKLTLGAEASTNTDLFEVYELHDGRPGTRLWRAQRKGGLAGSDPPLLAEYRRRVDELARKLGI